MMVNLPNSWSVVPLDQICDRVRGVSYKPDEASSTPKDGYLPILRANNIQNDRLTYDDLVYVLSDRVNVNQFIRDGDIVIAMSSGSKSVVGKTAQAVSPWNGAFGAFCGILRPHEGFQKRYLGFFLRTHAYRHKISELSAGSNINNLKAEHFSQIEVPLAPAHEQKRIVAKLDTVLNKMHVCETRLERIPVILKRFRQSVLAAACSGRLTTDWRDQNLHAQVSLALRRRISVNVEIDIPTSWLGCRVGDVMVLKGGYAFKSSDYSEEGIPLVRISNIQGGNVTLENAAKLPAEKANWNFAVESGDLLVAMSGATTGKFGVYGGILKCLQNQRVGNIKIRTPEDVTPGYRNIYLFSLQRRIEEEAYGGAQPNVSPSKIEALPFACPPGVEQQEIVRRVESLFTLADQLEARYKKGKAYVDKLTQSILAKAFRGELVPQDPNDEPAEKLLERIQMDRPGKSNFSNSKSL